MNTLRYDINATVPSGTSKAQFQLMLRNLLKTRFRMRSHWETRELSVYALLVAKNGPKIEPTAATEASGGPGRPVMDMSGLKGSEPGLFAALVKQLVIDGAEKVPTEN